VSPSWPSEMRHSCRNTAACSYPSTSSSCSYPSRPETSRKYSWFPWLPNRCSACCRMEPLSPSLLERSDSRASTASPVAKMIAVAVTGSYCCLNFVRRLLFCLCAEKRRREKRNRPLYIPASIDFMTVVSPATATSLQQPL
jgi:hypothetical protein